MMLPYRTKRCLYRFRILKFTHLLKLVNTNYYMTIFALCYYLNHIKHFLWIMSLWSDAERNADF